MGGAIPASQGFLRKSGVLTRIFPKLLMRRSILNSKIELTEQKIETFFAMFEQKHRSLQCFLVC
jgi:hypothetical protein